MDTQASTGTSAPDPPKLVCQAAESPTATDTISFPSLNRLLDDYALTANGGPQSPWLRWSLPVGLAGAVIGIVLGHALDGSASGWGAFAGLIIELAGLGTWSCLQLKGAWRTFVHAKSAHADDLERDYHLYRQLVQSIQLVPLAERQRRLRFIRDRRATMQDRLGLFTGSMEKLGVLPILLALYLQFKDWQWADWRPLYNVTLAQGLLAALLFTVYLLSWFLIRLRLRLQSYELLLEESSRQDNNDA